MRESRIAPGNNAGDLAEKDKIICEHNDPNTKSADTTTHSMRRKGGHILTNSNVLVRVQTTIMTVQSDAVYSDDETYGQEKVPDFMTDNNKHQKDNQLAGNSSLGVYACLHVVVMPAAIRKRGMKEVVLTLSKVEVG